MRLEEARSLMERARRSIRSARVLLDNGDHDFAVSRAYYAMFYAATAALLVRDVRRRKHAGVIAAFGEHLVKPGTFPREHQQALQAAFRDREKGDYGDFFPARNIVEQRIAEATELVAAVDRFLRDEGIAIG